MALTVLYVPYSFDSVSERGPCCLEGASLVSQVEKVVVLAAAVLLWKRLLLSLKGAPVVAQVTKVRGACNVPLKRAPSV